MCSSTTINMRSKDIDKKFKNYFKVHFFVLNLLGVSVKSMGSPLKNIVYNTYSLLLFLFCFILYPISELVYVIRSGDVEDFTFVFSFLLTQILGALKLIIVVIYKTKIISFCNSIETEPFLPDQNRSGHTEFTHIEDAIRTSNNQAYFFHSFVVVVISQRYFYTSRAPGYYKSIFDHSSNVTTVKYVRMTPFYTTLPFGQIDSPEYEVTVLYQVISAAVIGFTIGAVDAIIGGILCHIKAQLLILKDCLATYHQRAIYLMNKDGIYVNTIETTKHERNVFNQFNDVQKPPSILLKYVDICVIQMIKHHQKIIELADGAEDTFSLLMLVQFVFSLVLICFQLFQLSITDVHSAKFASMVCYFLLMVLQVALYCWYGNEIMVHSYNINDAIFQSTWIVTNATTQKALLIMLMRACRPIKMTAGKFSVLSLESFVAIIRGSGSYFMVLKNTQEVTL